MDESTRNRARRPLTEAEQRQVVEEAFKAQEREAERREKEARLAELGRAAAELGLDPTHLDEGEAIVRMRAEEAERRASATRSRRRVVLAGLLGVAGLGALVAAGWLLAPEPAALPPASATVAMVDGAWTLDANPATEAQATSSSGWAALTVTRFGAEADGKYWANLETRPDLDWTDASAVTLTVQGTLPKGRLYLENGDERWRSPEFALPAAPTPVRLEIADFEHQRRTEGEWKVVDQAPPTQVRALSLKVGWWINDLAHTGDVVISGVVVER